MKKFVVVYTRPSLFRKERGIASFREEYYHAVDAWRYAQRLRELDAKDGRWPLLSVEILHQ